VPARHAAYYLRRGESWASDRSIEDAGSVEYRRLIVEMENLLAALRWGAAADPALAARMALVLDAALALSGPNETHGRVIEMGLQGPSVDPHLRSRLFTARAAKMRLSGKLDRAREDLERALTEARRHGDGIEEAHALVVLGDTMGDVGDMMRARMAAERALGIARALGQSRVEALALLCLARVDLDSGDAEGVEQRCREASTILRKLGLRRLRSRLCYLLGHACTFTARQAQAVIYFREALTIARELSDSAEECSALLRFGKTLADGGRHEQAEATYDEAAALARRMGYQRMYAMVLSYRGRLEHDRGRLDMARALYEEAIAVHRDIGARPQEVWTLDALALVDLEDKRLDDVRTRLAAFDAADYRFPILQEASGLTELGAVEAIRDRLPESRAAFDRVREMLRSATNAEIVAEAGAFADALEGLFDLAMARAQRGYESEVAHRAKARARLGDGSSIADRSPLVRIGRRILARALEEDEAERTSTANVIAHALEVGADGRWFRYHGREPVDLSRRGSLRRLLRRLAEESASRRELSPDELFDAGWPDQRIAYGAALRRVYTAIGLLRDLGLRDVLVWRERGYVLEPIGGLIFPAKRDPS
jgi:tetratricopeptide (TPR) repeat protein